MRNFKKFLSIVMLLSTVSSGYSIAQVKTNLEGANIVVEGVVVDSIKQSNPHIKREVILNFSTFASDHSIAPCSVYEFDIYAEPIKVNLSSITNFTYLTIEIEGVTKRLFKDNIYILEKGDSVKFNLSEDSYEFSGRGSEKLNCQSEMYDLQFRPNESELKFLNNKDYKMYFELTAKRMDSILMKQLEVVDRYALKIGKKMTEIMVANAYGNRYSPALSSYIMMTRLSFPDLLPAFLKSEAYKNIDMELNQKFDPYVLTSSPNYCNFLMEKIVVDNAIEKNSNAVRSKIEMPSLVFNAIKTTYRGLLREKLFAMFFLKYIQNSESLQYLDEAMQYVKNNEINDILIGLKNTKTKGASFFPFELEDVNGNTTKLSDLNGKVVVLDFWYSGCENCIILHDGMKPVVEKFKNNPKVEFVSVSIDKNKSTWLKSIASGKYTDPNGLNLYTNGLGYHHPLIEKYYIRGYPTVFVLKNGKIISAAPPRPDPSRKPSNELARAKFISLIEESLDDYSFIP